MKGNGNEREKIRAMTWWMLALGFLVGISLGIGMLVGALIVVGKGASSGGSLFGPETLLNATATESSDSMAIATGFIDEDVEGLFVLDFITGNLQVFVINPRSGQLGGMYAHNVAAVLGAQKAPKYLLVTGQAMSHWFTGNVRPARSRWCLRGPFHRRGDMRRTCCRGIARPRPTTSLRSTRWS